MPQTKYDIKISDQQVANNIIKETEAVQGVKFINVNIDNCIVVTHSEDYDEAAFKVIVGI